MEEKRIINAAIEYINILFADDCTGHDAEHSMRVYRNAVRIAETEQGCNSTVVMLAALLHDADDHK
ncbi:MAG: HD domain-containing protein, partial [Bacteroidaceae bacterium]|nr:HD domain-containing protein [Bacteroidaceae bacterium]